jgi:hypothetical protein
VRELPLYLNPQAEHVLDWFHLTMRLTVMGQYAKSLPEARAAASASSTGPPADVADDEDDAEAWEDEPDVVVTRDAAARELERLKWFLWHGTVFRALQVIEVLEADLDTDGATPAQRKLRQAVTEFGGYVRANGAWIPDYGDRHRNDEPISSAFVESAVNQVVSTRMVKQQQRRWSPRGAHLLLQIRTRVLNDDDLPAAFRRWYPGFQQETGTHAPAA